MTSTIHTDSEDESFVRPCPIRRTKPTAALLQHLEKATLPSQTRAINEFHAAEAAKRALEVPVPTAPIPSAQIPPLTPAQPESALFPPSALPSSNKCLHLDDAFEVKSVDEERENAHMNPRKKCKAPEKSPELLDGDGVPVDIDVSIVDQGSSQESKTANVDAFFGATFEHMGTNGKIRKHRKCNVCL